MMILKKYKNTIRKLRGHLKSNEDDLNNIFENGSDSLIEFSLGHKKIGVQKMAYIATTFKKKTQDELVKFMLTAKNVKEIDLKIMELNNV